MADFTSTDQGSALDQLQSRDAVELLNTIDRLRALGLSAELKLPQVIVCGDTSSGKSSVLEAISEVRFPATQSTCTRFATEVRLRRDLTSRNTVRIEPAEHRTPDDCIHLRAFGDGVKLRDVQEIRKHIVDAETHLNKLPSDGGFHRDILVVEIHGPDRPSLTLVDLPGFIHTSATEDGRDIATVKDIVNSYMKQPNTIILAVTDANNDWQNQIVLQTVKTHGAADRTLGIMTKLDMFPSSSPLGTRTIQSAKTGRNDYIALRYGWHMLRNRDWNGRDMTFEERNKKEREFFSQDGWNDVPENNRGASTLQDKLSKMLLKEIRTNLPTILNDIRTRGQLCESRAELLGKSNRTEADMREQLATVSKDLHKLIDAATSGDYVSSPFFLQTSQENISTRRLRACLRSHLGAFATDMHREGMRFRCVQDDAQGTETHVNLCAPSNFLPQRPLLITAQNLRQSFEEYVRCNVGIEVSGKLPPSIYGSILSFQCSRWDQIATNCAQHCVRIARECFSEALGRTSPAHIAAAVHDRYIAPHFERAQAKVTEKLHEVLRPYKSGSFFMLNQLECEWEKIKSAGYAWDKRTPKPQESNTVESSRFEFSAYDDVLEWLGRAYPISLNTFLDNFANLAIEFCLVDDLHKLFTPIDIIRMDSKEVAELTREPENVMQLRINNDAELEALREALEVCTRHSLGLSSGQLPTPGSPPRTTPVQSTHAMVDAHATATADEPPQTSQPLDASSPTPVTSPNREPSGTVKKTRTQKVGIDLNPMTPPTTPPRTTAAGDQPSVHSDEQVRGNGFVRRARRKDRLSHSDNAVSPSRSPSPVAASYEEPVNDVPNSPSPLFTNYNAPRVDEPSSEEL